MNNFINIYDFFELIRMLKTNPKIISKITNKIFFGQKQKVKSTWAHTDSAPIHWWNIPEVISRWNFMITGDPQKEYYCYFSEKYLSGSSLLTALSLGCGTGHRELKWAETKKFKMIDAYDLSETRIEFARKMAKQNKMNSMISYHAEDIYKIPLKENYYDVIFGEQSLHHFTPLEELFVRVKKMMKPGGYFVINEYVGSNRFQWKEEQLKAANDLLNQLQTKYKTYWQQNTIKKRIFSPSRLRMLLNDPSEAVESENILPLMDKHFQLIELKNYGGTILQLVFDKIAHNFLSDELETKEILSRCFNYEDKLIADGILKSDFVFAVFKNKS
ncbi:MAG: class I SAM-dependent methyltransferase [Ignavibacteriales bacterium]|nr:class I SAM-dependent methyltransferase [Ignavibacteriales bacterium]